MSRQSDSKSLPRRTHRVVAINQRTHVRLKELSRETTLPIWRLAELAVDRLDAQALQEAIEDAR